MTGSFSPLCWNVEEPFTEEEYLIAINAYKGHKHYPKSLDKLVLPQDIKYKDINIIRTREHEWTHFRQHVSSHLGIFINNVHNILEQAFINHIKSENKIFSGEMFPLQAKDMSGESFDGNIYVWQIMNGLLGIMDRNTTTIKGVIYMWNTFCEIMSKEYTTNYARLNTKLDLSSLSNPDNGLTIYEISEGFSQYREIQHLLIYKPDGDDFVKVLRESVKGQYATALYYISENLNVPMYHWIVGALLDISIQEFKHPCYSNENTLYWEDIHPGYRLMDAVEYLKKKQIEYPQFRPDLVEECFNIALSAFGYEDQNSYVSKYVNSFDEYDVKAELRGSTIDYSDDNLNQSVTKFYTLIFNDAIKLRYLYPMIYLSPGVYARNEKAMFAFRNITRPPFIINSGGMFIPHDFDRSEWYGYACALMSIPKNMASELARYGRLKESLIIAEKLFLSYPDYAKKSDLKRILINTFGNNFNQFIENLNI